MVPSAAGGGFRGDCRKEPSRASPGRPEETGSPRAEAATSLVPGNRKPDLPSSRRAAPARKGSAVRRRAPGPQSPAPSLPPPAPGLPPPAERRPAAPYCSRWRWACSRPVEPREGTVRAGPRAASASQAEVLVDFRSPAVQTWRCP